ncbi:MAG: glycerol-3-phosphate transporter permease [Brevinemataceae bacterium]
MKNQIIFKDKVWVGFLFLLPQLLVIMLFFFYPAGEALIAAFFRKDAFGVSNHFVGLNNFTTLLKDPAYHRALVFSYKFAFWTIIGSIIPAIIISLSILRISKGRQIFQTLISWPLAVAPVIAGAMWLFLFDSSIGLIGRALIANNINWNPAISSGQSFFFLTLVSIWNRIGYNVIFIVSALYGIPHSLYEASALDAFSPWHRTFKITLPIIYPILFFLFIMNIVYSFFETFGIIDITTKGGPGSSTVSLVYKLYRDNFTNYGSSAAQSILLIMMVSGLIWLQFKYTNSKSSGSK